MKLRSESDYSFIIPLGDTSKKPLKAVFRLWLMLDVFFALWSHSVDDKDLLELVPLDGLNLDETVGDSIEELSMLGHRVLGAIVRLGHYLANFGVDLGGYGL